VVLLGRLPIAIELKLKSGKKIGLVHASLPDIADWLEVKKALESLSNREVNSFAPLLRDMIWDKAPVYDNYSINLEEVKNIDHVFHGHTIVKDIIVLENRTFMDLGSYNNMKLGFIQPDEYLESGAID